MRLVLLLFTLLAAISAFAETNIVWKVENPFAPFEWLQDDGQTTQKWTPNEGEPYIEWLKRTLPEKDAESPFAPFINSDKNPFINSEAHYKKEYAQPKDTTIRARLKNTEGECIWRVKGSEQHYTGMCNEDTQIKNVPLGKSMLTVTPAGRQPETIDIDIEHKVIVAIGDSYASGEGNPDIATKWNQESAEDNFKWLDNYKEPAKWWDKTCHRSFFSNQTFAALSIASQKPHRYVTYLQYSCSGAEVLDGLIVKQQTPPGKGVSEVQKSQLESVVTDLCVGETEDAKAEYSEMYDKIHHLISDRPHRLFKNEAYNDHGLSLVRCKQGFKQPDLILLSVGGNDAGFASLVSWAILPSNYWAFGSRIKKFQNVICPEQASDKCEIPFDTHLINQLDTRYEILQKVVNKLVTHGDTKIPVIHATYPNPLLKNDGTYYGDEDGNHPDNAWGVAKSKYRFTRKWEFNIRIDESRTLAKFTVPNMHEKIVEGAKANGYIVADMIDEFIGHGWNDPNDSDPPISLPSHTNSRDYNKWNCKGDYQDPSCWNGYAPMNRYIRTLNDAFLTQQSDEDDAQNGAVHPNAWGHAAMAEVLYKTAQDNVMWVKTDSTKQSDLSE